MWKNIFLSKSRSVWLIMMLLPAIAIGQSSKKKHSASMIPGTSNTIFLDMEKNKKEARKTNLRYIYKTDAQKLMIGNLCVEEYTRSMGFVYVLTVPEENGDANIGNFFHNLGTSVVLTFTNGPFWSRKVRKRINSCKMSSGDFVG